MYTFLKAIFSRDINFKSVLKLAFFNIKIRHRQTLLGPVWVVLQSYIFIFFISFLFTKAFNNSFEKVIPHFASGFVIWLYFSSSLKENCSIFFSSRGLLLSIPNKEFFIFYRTLAQNIIVFFYNFLVLLIVLIFLKIQINSFLFLMNFIILNIFLIFFSYILSSICTRFQDLAKVFASFLQVMFFVTPIVWEKKYLAKYQYIHDWNIFYVIVEICRATLIDRKFNTEMYYTYSFSFIFISLIVCSILYKKYHRKISLWV